MNSGTLEREIFFVDEKLLSGDTTNKMTRVLEKHIADTLEYILTTK